MRRRRMNVRMTCNKLNPLFWHSRSLLGESILECLVSIFYGSWKNNEASNTLLATTTLTTTTTTSTTNTKEIEQRSENLQVQYLAHSNQFLCFIYEKFWDVRTTIRAKFMLWKMFQMLRRYLFLDMWIAGWFSIQF